MSYSLAHAKHVHAVHEHLCNKTTFFDWQVVTAFYSALHYVTHKLFVVPRPLPHDATRLVSTFSAYASAVNQHIRPAYIPPHDLRKQLVAEHCSDIADAYERLFDAANSARYKNFNVSQMGQQFTAKDYKTVIDFCTST